MDYSHFRAKAANFFCKQGHSVGTAHMVTVNTVGDAYSFLLRYFISFVKHILYIDYVFTYIDFVESIYFLYKKQRFNSGVHMKPTYTNSCTTYIASLGLAR